MLKKLDPPTLSGIKIERKVENDLIVYTLYLQGVSAIDFELINDFLAAFDYLESLSETFVVITTNLHEKIFCPGFNLRKLPQAKTLQESIGFLAKYGQLLKRFFQLPFYTIAAINGHAIAGGFGLILAHDFRIMGKGCGIMSMSEINIGMPIPLFMVNIVKEKIPSHISHEILMTGRNYTPDEGLEHGFIDKLSERSEVLKDSIKFAKTLKNAGNKKIISSIRKTIYYNLINSFETDAYHDGIIEFSNENRKRLNPKLQKM